MRTVWKYELPITGDTLELPAGARIVHVASQFGDPSLVTLWAEVDPNAPYEHRSFMVVGTGHPIAGGTEYCGSGIAMDGHLVWHVYEVVSIPAESSEARA